MNTPQHDHGGGPAQVSPSPDAALFDLIRDCKEWERVALAAEQEDPVANAAEMACLHRIADTPAVTLAGAVAKLRLFFTDDEVQSWGNDTPPLDRIAGSAVADLLRLSDGGAS